jgi:GNAT superfamily N-acetyltransferase
MRQFSGANRPLPVTLWHVTANDSRTHAPEYTTPKGLLWHVRDVTPVEDPSAPSFVYFGDQQIAEEWNRDVLGHTDLVDPPSIAAIGFADQKHNKKTYLVAMAGPAPVDAELGEHGFPLVSSDAALAGDGSPEDVLGGAWVGQPTLDNFHIAWTSVGIRKSAAQQGIGTALADIAEKIATDAGRTTLSSWTGHRLPDEDDTDVLIPPTGVGRVPNDESARFAQARGFQLEQAERHSQLDLPVDPEKLAEFRRQAQAKAADYEVVTWVGRTPEEHISDMVELHRRMSIDIPLGGLDFQEEVWDEERVRDDDDRQEKASRIPFWAAARHIPTGQLVAYTAINTVPEPDYAFQNDTLVHGDHRGHRLGMLVKAANLQELAAQRPALKRVHTWNAGENSFMLAINVALGFRPVSVEGAWQKKVD